MFGSYASKRHWPCIATALMVMGAVTLSAWAGAPRFVSDPPGDGLTPEGRLEIYGPYFPEGATRDILIADKTRPNAYFGMYRASQMTQPGWDLYERTVDWANGFKNPATSKVWLATYNGSLNPQYSAEKDGIAVYNRLINNMGFLAGNIHVAHQSTIETGNFAGYDIVLYAWTYPRNATNVMNQNIPFVTVSAGETDEMGIGTGQSTMHAYRDYAFIFDNSHYVTKNYPLGKFTLQSGMWMDASTVAGNGQVLVNADIPEPSALTLLAVAGVVALSRRRP